MSPYNQQKVDRCFDDLLQHCHELGFHKLAAHYEKAQGMQRVQAVRELDAIFAVRERNTRKVVHSLIVAIIMLLALSLVVLIRIGGMP